MGTEEWYALLVEPLKGATSTTGVLVGVRPLPVLKVQRRLGQIIQGVLRLGLSRDQGLVVILLDLLLLRRFLSFRGLLGLRSLLLLLLLWWRVCGGLLRESGLAEDRLQAGLVNDRVEVTEGVGEF